MESACSLFLYRCYQEAGKRGEAFVKDEVVNLIAWDNKQVKVTVHASGSYNMQLLFRSGGLSRHCDFSFTVDFCKHMIAVAIVCYQAKDLTLPPTTEFESELIPPPLVETTNLKIK